MIHIFHRTAREKKLRQVDAPKKGAWIDVYQPDDSDFSEISDITGLEKSTLIDTRDIFEVPRVERDRHSGNIIVILRIPYEGDNDIHTDTLTLIYSDTYLVTVHSGYDTQLFDAMKKDRGIATTQTSKLLIYFFNKVAGIYTRRITDKSQEVFSKKRDHAKVSTDEIKNLAEAEEVLDQYLTALIPMKNVFEQLMGGSHIKLYEPDQELLFDAYNSITQSVDLCKVTIKSIRNTRDVFQTIFTNRLNRAVQYLTGITIVMTVPTIISSVMGMNVRVPGQDNPYAFWYVLIGSAVAALLVYLSFKFRDWI